LLEQLHAFKFLGEEANHCQTVLLDEDILDETFDFDKTVVVCGFVGQVRAQSIYFDLLENDVLDTDFLCVCNCINKLDSRAERCVEFEASYKLFFIVTSRFSDLELNLEACSVLVLDVLRASVTAEDAATHHNSHLG
jgi:hypothetical protein